MSKGDLIEMEGQLEEAKGGGFYSVKLKENDGVLVRARLSGKMKKNNIRVLPGDDVKVALSPYDTTHGIIIRRHK